MKKSILAIALIFSMSLILTSCKDSTKQSETEVEETDHVVEKAEIAMNDAYICPMGCEGDKTYDKEGACPVCKMNLKKVEGESDHDESEEHEHNDSEEN